MAGPLPQGDPAPIDGLLPSTAVENSKTRSLHAYVHIPFCKVRCGYCDFNTYTAIELPGASQAEYSKVLKSEIEFSNQVLANSGYTKRKLSTVFFGGGTPTQLPASDLVEMLESLRENFGIVDGAEVTTEANPDTITREYLEELKAGGFNRISLGMQSAEPSVLKTLDRSHNPQNVVSAVKAAHDVGLETSIDLIYGAPGETLEQWRTSLNAAIDLGTNHISAYSLIVEPGTKLARQISSGELSDVDDDEQADKYELADQMLSEAGFSWYEVSNWSKSIESRSAHNLAYWQSQDWWGYGPGAHSHFGGVRWWNVKHPKAYSEKLTSLGSPAAGRETLTDETRLEERVLLEIRISDGLSIETAKSINPNAANLIAEFISEELVDAKAALAGSLVLTLKGRLLADALVRKLLTT
ncbi:MAG: radical SAM family heme chaperone HemW [Rhodoluna sp.]